MAQTKRQIAIQASIKRRFKIGDSVHFITKREGSVKEDFVATGKVTEVKNIKPSELHDQSNQFVTVKINEKGRKITGLLGSSAHSNQFIKATEKTNGKSFINIRKRFLIDADELKRTKIATK